MARPKLQPDRRGEGLLRPALSAGRPDAGPVPQPDQEDRGLRRPRLRLLCQPQCQPGMVLSTLFRMFSD